MTDIIMTAKRENHAFKHITRKVTMDKEQLIKLGKAIEYMRGHYQSPIKVNEIAEYAGLTPKALNRIKSDRRRTKSAKSIFGR